MLTQRESKPERGLIASQHDPGAALKLIIQIPAFNEEKTLERVLRELPQKIEGIDTIETLVVDDGSSDATAEVARKAGADHVVRLTSNRGLATAFLAGINASLRLGADIIVNTDADNQYRGADVAKLVAPIVAGRAEVVIGDRDVANSPYMNPVKRLLQRIGSWAVGLASGVKVGDVTSGFRAFSRDAAFQINVFNPFTYTLETIIQAGNRNLNVQTVKVGTNAPTRQSRLYRGITTYIRKSVVTIFRIYTLYRPLKTFFTIGSLLFLAGFAIGVRFLYYYVTSGSAGHIQSLILAAVLLLSGFQTMLIGLVADLISVNRRLSEDMLIRIKKLEHPQKAKREWRGAERRQERRREEPRTKTAASPPAETQWVWLVDETERAGEREEKSASETEQQKKKRRRRRRSDRDPAAPRERHPHHRTRTPESE